MAHLYCKVTLDRQVYFVGSSPPDHHGNTHFVYDSVQFYNIIKRSGDETMIDLYYSVNNNRAFEEYILFARL